MLTFEASPGMMVMVVPTKPSKAVQERVEKRAAACKCIVVEVIDGKEVMCEESAFKRGVCQTHYGDFRTGLAKQPFNEQQIWEEKQIKLGRILRSRQGQRLNKRNIYLSGK